MELYRLRKKIESFEEPIIKLLYKRSLYKQNLSNFDSNYLSLRLLKRDSLDNIEFKEYIDLLITPLCESGEDSFLKTTKRLNKKIIRLINKRVNLGKKVGKVKLKRDYQTFNELKLSNELEKMEEIITNSDLENKILERVSSMYSLYFQDDAKKREIIKQIYEKIIKKTKEVQIEEIVRKLNT